MEQGSDKRKFIRHPVEIPIEYEVLADNAAPHRESVNNISLGGLSFICEEPLAHDQRILIRIPMDDMLHTVQVRVVWCEKTENGYDIGVEFFDMRERFKTRMVEQICRIEEYRNRMLTEEGREMTKSEAAEEWITRYSDKFPW